MKIKRTDLNLTINEAIRQFIVDKRLNGTSEQTLLNYESSCYYLMKKAGIELNQDVTVLTKETISNLILQLKSSVAISSVNHYIRDTRVFLYWLMDNNYIERFQIKQIKCQDTKIKFFTDEEIEKLLVKPTDKNNFCDNRMWTIIAFILATGARVETVVNIKVEDLDFKNNEITYTHLKNKQVATIPMSDGLKSILMKYLKTWTNAEYLFCDQRGFKLTTNALRHYLTKYCKRRGIKPRGPHALRHSFARDFIKAGGSSFKLQKILTHSTLDMTKRYVRLFSEDLKDGFTEVCPLDKMIKTGTKIERTN